MVSLLFFDDAAFWWLDLVPELFLTYAAPWLA